MKALSLINKGDARIVEISEPVFSADDLLLRVDMVGLCGTDLNSFRGNNPLVTYPRVLGHEIAATVLQGTSGVPAGTRVAVSPYTSCGRCPSCRRGRFNACRENQTFGVQRDGALTELLVVPEGKVYPSALSTKELCLVEPLTVGFHAVARARVTETDVVAVFGCGGIGLGAVAGSAFRRARTIAIDLDDTKLETARAAGAKHLINSEREDFRARLQELTDGDGPDVVIEAIGLQATFQAAVQVVAFTGRVVYIGYAKEPVAYETKLFVQKELDILGSRNALPEDFRQVIAMLGAGRFPVDLAVSAIVGLEEAPSMLAKWSSSPADYTKIMVQIHL
ncbi:zinc-binding alcohol dehydrogenase family protein [Tunturiibacter empetritectus]|uniref:Threonine dehydrogenase-like Zn-dependent dehydrogenase n=2 Tax=Tunturiibacter TaxID=3154218 RepID=A0A852VKX3_9BACT|nr:zinc-binding alcohol dehydrogenase family protein [Edaphobacter lichenicola]NYF90196.1 threonine dehydrogenase-like Zn-dependent dehydrogenase [Edaphobacter lichenicola]